MLVQFAQIEEPVDPAQQVVGWNVIFQVQTHRTTALARLADDPSSRKIRSPDGASVDQVQPADSTEFFNRIGQ
ncbi:MAG: hypothetical protein H0W24_04210 [Lysobacter sp.]|nr:hypothetical protein [Lysobacter sp.]